jgi:hypothetical protein
MASKEPAFLKSKYFVGEPGNWYLKEGAPTEIVKEFMQYDEEENVEGPKKLKAKDLKLN